MNPRNLRAILPLIPPSRSVVFAGAGRGLNIPALQTLGPVQAFDASPRMCELAPTPVHCADARALPLDRQSVDTLIWNSGVCVPGREIELLREADRVLRPDGRLLFAASVTSRDSSQMGQRLGIHDGRRQLNSRVLDLWTHSKDIEASSELVAGWRALPVSRARALVRAHETELSALRQVIDGLAIAVAALGEAPEPYLRAALGESEPHFLSGELETALAAAGFAEVELRRDSASDLTVLALARRQPAPIELWSEPRVLLVSPPWRTPFAADLALATLTPVLTRAGLLTDELHGAMLMPRDRQTSSVAQARAFESTAMQSFAAAAVEGTGRAATALDRCVARCLHGHYDVIGFSCLFEAQLPAALAIAKRVKAVRPHVRVIFGGAACLGEPGAELLRSYPEVDVVCSGAGEQVVVPLVRALRSGGELRDVAGIRYRDGGGGIVATSPAKPLSSLDELPIPDFRPFEAQLARSEWADAPVELYFEASRGCWWGETHLCLFCGLNADSLTYRRKSSGRVVREVATLYERHPLVHGLHATDNILDMGFFDTTLDELDAIPTEPDRPLRLYFETKSNLKRPQLEALSRVVTHIQPGIESLSDNVLRLMRKGATAHQQLTLLKWAHELGIGLNFNIITHNPGEQATDYDEMLAVLPYVTHLPKPQAVTPMALMRFSPYHRDPARFGITNIRPLPYYSSVFTVPEPALGRLAYRFAYDHPSRSDHRLTSVLEEVTRAVEMWMCSADHAHWWREQGGIRVECTRDQVTCGYRVDGLAARLFEYLDRSRPEPAMLREVDVHEEILHAALATWNHRRWVVTGPRDRHLNVIPRGDADRGVPSPL